MLLRNVLYVLSSYCHHDAAQGRRAAIGQCEIRLLQNHPIVALLCCQFGFSLFQKEEYTCPGDDATRQIVLLEAEYAI